MALEKSNQTHMVTDHSFQTKAEAESAWNTYGSELAADIGNCGVCNRPYEEHEHSGAKDLERALTEAHKTIDDQGHIKKSQEACNDIIRMQSAALASSPLQMDEQGRLVLSDEEIERVAHRVIEIVGKEMTKWLSLLQLNFPKGL